MTNTRAAANPIGIMFFLGLRGLLLLLRVVLIEPDEFVLVVSDISSYPCLKNLFDKYFTIPSSLYHLSRWSIIGFYDTILYISITTIIAGFMRAIRGLFLRKE